MLTTDGSGPFVPPSVLTSAMSPPKVVVVSSQAARTMLAPGAAADAHSTSIAASPSSPYPGSFFLPWKPGFVQGMPPEGLTCVNDPVEYFLSPNVSRKTCQSLVL